VNYDKLSLYSGHLFFIGLITAALVLFKERLFAFDTAYYTFHVLNYGEYFIKHNRFISYLTQWVLLTGIHFKWPLALTLSLFSASFYVWFYAIFIILVHYYKNIFGGLFLVLSLVLTMRFKFFAAISEITFALCLSAALIILVDHFWSVKKIRTVDVFFFILLGIGILGSHLAVLYPLLIALAALFILRKAFCKWQNWIWPCALGFVFLLKYFGVQSDDYESDKLSVLQNTDLIKNLFLKFPDYTIADILMNYLLEDYLPILLFFTGLIGLFIYRKNYLPSFILFVGILGWLAINALIYSYLNDHILIMVDGYLALLGPIIALPIYFLLTDETFAVGVKKGLLIVTLGLLAYSSHQMLDKRKFFQQRLENIRQTMELNEGCVQKKFLVSNEQFNWQKMWYPYELPHESLLLSALNGRENCYTIYANTDSPAGASFLQTTGFLQFNHASSMESINNSFYFELPEAPYCEIDTILWQ
jgi:hypothetical protein